MNDTSLPLKINTEDDTELLVDTAQMAAAIILESGGETFRAEETASILCRSAGRDEAEVFALPTGLFLTAERKNGSKVSSVRRIRSRSNNLYKIDRVNTLCREFSAHRITLAELNTKLSSLKDDFIYSRTALSSAAGLSSMMFTLLFEQALSPVVLFDMLVAFGGAFVAQFLCLSSRMKRLYQFTVTFIGSLLLAVLAVLAVGLSGIGNLTYILIGAITPLLPGLSLTNAIRDTVMGDLVSGTVRLVETLLIAIGIAGGVGVVLAVYLGLGGGI